MHLSNFKFVEMYFNWMPYAERIEREGETLKGHDFNLLEVKLRTSLSDLRT